MKKFLLGLAVGAVAVYAASKMIDDDVKEEFYDNLNDKYKSTKRHAKRASLKARKEFLARKEQAQRVAGDLADKVSDDFHDLEEKFKEKAGKYRS